MRWIVECVVVKDGKVFTIEDAFKNIGSNKRVTFIPDSSIDFKVLKNAYPHASLRLYNDSRLSNNMRALVDKEDSRTTDERSVATTDASNPPADHQILQNIPKESLVEKLAYIWKHRKSIKEGFVNYYLGCNDEVEAEAQRRLSICRSNVCGYYDKDGTSGNMKFYGMPGCRICGCSDEYKARTPADWCALANLKEPKEPLWKAMITTEMNQEIFQAQESKKQQSEQATQDKE